MSTREGFLFLSRSAGHYLHIMPYPVLTLAASRTAFCAKARAWGNCRHARVFARQPLCGFSRLLAFDWLPQGARLLRIACDAPLINISRRVAKRWPLGQDIYAVGCLILC